jgi:SOS-response transcriptional repressor LexA
LFSPSADFLLRVRGASMQDAGILDGDLLAVHKTAEARSGQVVVARLGDEVTVKRLKRRGREITLVAENAAFAPIVVDPALIRAFEIEKECYEFIYAATYLPSWLWAPTEGMRGLFA